MIAGVRANLESLPCIFTARSAGIRAGDRESDPPDRQNKSANGNQYKSYIAPQLFAHSRQTRAQSFI